MYNEDRKELMDEGYTEALDLCKAIVEKRLSDWLLVIERYEGEIVIDKAIMSGDILIQQIFKSIKKDMEEL